MNRPPARHPAFLVVACMALAGAWSTSAFEAELAQKEPAAVDRVALLRDAPDCLDAGGPRRALCLYQSTLGSAAEPSSAKTVEPAGTAMPTVGPMRPAAITERVSVGRMQDRPAIGTRTATATGP